VSTRTSYLAICLFAPGFLAFVESAWGVPAPFTEEAVARGVNYHVAQGSYTGSFGCGVAAVDLDGDLDADLIVTGGAGGAAGIYENIGGGQFVDRSATSGIPVLTAASGVVCGDYDADGDLDIYFSNWLVANVLARNDGGFMFTDVAAAAGVADVGAGVGCAWADYDLDGRLDLYLANRTGTDGSMIRNRLYRNLGDGTFSDMAPTLGVDDRQFSFQGFFFDMDRDGDSDLFVSSDLGDTTRLFENAGDGTFIDRTFTSGVGVNIKGMGVTAADINGDGLFDVYETNTPDGNPLFTNLGAGQFIDQSATWGVSSNRIGWGALFFDYDNDAQLDLYVCNQENFIHQAGENRLFVHGGAAPCQDIAPSMSANVAGESYCLAAADFDEDGDIDLVVQNYDQPIRVLMNQEGATRNWLRIKVIGEMGNTDAVGALIELGVGTNSQLREIRAGENFKSQNEHIAHFGLDATTTVDEIHVTWPGGAQRTLTSVSTNQLIAIAPPDRLGDMNLDGKIDSNDISRFVGAITGANTSVIDVALADANADGTTSLNDVPAFVERLLD
jgi:ASPIC and UnbV/FG-GAP-like repeat/Dockerin type I domain